MPIAVNDLPVILQWKVKNAWKVEIENIGVVKAKGLIILNNINQHSQIALKAFGRKGSCQSQILDLNYHAYRLEPYLQQVLEDRVINNKLFSSTAIKKLNSALDFNEANIIELYQAIVNIESGPGMAIVNKLPKGVDTQHIENTLSLLSESQQKYFAREIQIKNPENYRSENLYQ